VVASLDGYKFIAAPPLGILLDQQMIETASKTSDDVSKKSSYLEQHIFALITSADDEGLTLYPLNVSVKLGSPTTAPHRVACTLSVFKEPFNSEGAVNTGEPSRKRRKQECINGSTDLRWSEDLMAEAGRFAALITNTLELADRESSSFVKDE
jgi:hypothetical protein